MKKIIIVLAVIILSLASAVAQERAKSFIRLGIGGASPVGVFGSTGNESDAGFASGGAVFSLDAGFGVSKVVQIGILYSGSAYSLDAQAIANQLARELPNTNIIVSGEPYALGRLMAGVLTEVPLDPETKWLFTTKAYIGLSLATAGEVKIETDDGQTKQKLEVTEASTNTFGGLFGGGLKRTLGKSFALGVFIDYSVQSPTFEYNIAGRTEKVKQPMNGVEYGISIEYRW